MDLTLTGVLFSIHEKGTSGEAVHLWLIWLKATQAISRYAEAEIQEAGGGEANFRVLEVLLQRALPVNTIGPIVNLTPGSISGAGPVSRIESVEDRMRIVELAWKGPELITRVFQMHTATMNELSRN